MYDVAGTVDAQGRHAEAEKMYRETLELWQRVFGNRHLRTRQSMSSLADVLSAQGKREEAEELRKELHNASKDGPR